MIRTKSREQATYIQAMLRELVVIAKAERLDMLTYFVEMAYLEACDTVRSIQADAPIRPHRRAA